MNPADWIIVAVIGISTLISLLRGFTREAISLASWVLAFVGARVLSPSLAELFAGWFDNPEWQELAAFATLFVAILVTGMIVAHLLGEAVRNSALSFGDRVLGTGFGFVRGILIVLVAVAFGAAWFASEAWWTSSRFIPQLALLESWTRETTHALSVWISG
ncbi:MAG: CvpA family protein [Pseudomonadota bacterium]